MNKKIVKKAFTLVELIVVITILAILATVAFVSFQGYGQSSRDSVRLADLKNMEKVINLYRLTNSRYPTPDEAIGITYSGSTAWTQGVFGTKAYTSNASLSNVPTDPLTGLPYAYSVTNTKQEYQMAAVLEGEVSNFNTQSYAGVQVASAYIRGDYNGQFIKVSTNSTNYLLGVPSIIASDITSADMMDIVNNQRLVYKGYNNLPASFSGSQYNTNPTNGFNFTPNQVILFEGDISALEDDISERTMFLDNLQTNYGGTEIAAESSILEVLEVDTSSDSIASNYIATVLNNSLKMNIKDIIISTLYPSGCDQPDIIIGAYTIAACNAGTSVTGTGTESYGGLYQWGNNEDFRNNQFSNGEIYTPNVSGPVTSAISNTFITASSDWLISPDDNLWGDITNTNLARQGVCADGYHIPTKDEWQGVVTAGGFGNDGIAMSNTLKSPLAGYRINTTAALGNQDNFGIYWMSSHENSNADRIFFNSTYLYPINATNRVDASSIRCFKN